MASRISNLLPFLIITLACVVGVEAGYLALERFVIDPVIMTKPKTEQQNVQRPKQSLQRPQAAVRVDYGVITKRNLFGAPPQLSDPLVQETPPEELEATSLEVVLMGTVGGEEESRAIILNKRDRKQEIYSVGDRVQGALIKEIRRGQVILNLDGRDEMLDMSEAAQYAPKSPSRPVSVNPSVRSRRTLETPTLNGSRRSNTTTRTRIVRPTRRIIRPQPEEDQDQDSVNDIEEVELLDELEDEALEEINDESLEEDTRNEENLDEPES